MRVEVNPGYIVDTALRKKPFAPGEQFNVDDQEGRRLVEHGAVTAVANESGEGGGKLNVAKTIELVVAACFVSELDKLAEGETRKGVLDAIDKRRKELEQQT